MGIEQTKNNLSLTRRQVAIGLWLLIVCIAVACFICPIKSDIIRSGTVGGLFFVWLGALILFRNSRIVQSVGLSIAFIAILIVLLPGWPINPLLLQAEYTKSLTQYDRVTYLWGGESPFGIDCSGLMRRGLIDAELNIGMRTCNARALRDAFSLYWNDCTAEQLGKGYHGRTRLVTFTPSINAIKPNVLRPGDIAVTDGGAHVLAYLGSNEWIDADPKPWRVDRVHTPALRNPWFRMLAWIMRWRSMEQ